VAQHIANAATPALPPASAILTAFTYVMGAAKGVSDDYDMVESFFDIMNGFLERLSLLERKLPPEKPYQVSLIRVFSSILNLSAIARTYREKGRFSNWAKNLVEHQDSNLKGAYDLLQKHLSHLESITLMATIKQTMVITKDVTALGSAVNVLGTKMDLGLRVTQQSLAVGVDTKAFAERAAMMAVQDKELDELTLEAIRQQTQDVQSLKNLVKHQQMRDDKRGRAAKDGVEHKDSGAKKKCCNQGNTCPLRMSAVFNPSHAGRDRYNGCVCTRHNGLDTRQPRISRLLRRQDPGTFNYGPTRDGQVNLVAPHCVNSGRCIQRGPLRFGLSLLYPGRS
jgi:hypothetical protein